MGVDVVVSKWDVAYQKPDAQVIDVTLRMIEPFEPSERTLKMIEGLSEAEPLPLYETDWEAMRDH